MFNIIYYIALAIVIIVGIAVFYCIFHAYYHEYKNTPKEKKPRKILTYSIVIVIGLSLVLVGQHYFKGSEYVQNLWESWTKFEKGEYQTDQSSYDIELDYPYTNR